MSVAQPAIILVAGILAQWLAWRLHIPAILVLLATGLALGPGWHIVDVEKAVGGQLETIIGLSVAVVLFEGGLNLRFRDVRNQGPIVARLVTTGVIITALIGTAAGVLLLDLPVALAAILATLLTVSGPTVVLPLLHHVRPDKATASVLRWEGILVDPVGALLALLVFEAVLAGSAEAGVAVIVSGIAKATLAGGAIGVAGAALLAFVEGKYLIPDRLGAAVGLAVVIGGYAAADALQPESGLLAVTVMGIALANQRYADIRHILDFKEDLTQVLLGVLFILLAARISRQDILSLDASALFFVLTLVFIARPLAVAASAWGGSLGWRQQAFLAWMAPRGIIAAAVSAFFAIRLEAIGVEGADRLVPVTFLTIVATVALYGLTARPVARLLGVAAPVAEGVLFIGANPVARALARPMHEAGIPVLLVDRNPDAAMAARMEGMPALRSDAFDRAFEVHHDLDEMGSVWALTPNANTNVLACIRFQEHFGRGRTFLIDADGEGEDHGRLLWPEHLDYRRFRSRLRAGWRIAQTPITESFDIAAWRREHGQDAIGLYRITAKGHVAPFHEGRRFTVEPGERLIGLVPGDGGGPSPEGP